MDNPMLEPQNAEALSKPQNAKASPQVPLKMRLEGVIGVPDFENNRCGEGNITLVYSSEGASSHLERVTGAHSHCITPGLQGAFNGISIFTAANGDELHTAFEPVVFPSPTDPNTLIITNPVVITGGTGRFTNATGNADASGEVDLLSSTFFLNVDGILNLSRPRRPHADDE